MYDILKISVLPLALLNLQDNDISHITCILASIKYYSERARRGTAPVSEASSKNQYAREKERSKPTVHQTKIFVYVP